LIEETLSGLVAQALASVSGSAGRSTEDLPPVEISRPRQKEHGDFSTNAALVLASSLGRNPREVAAEVVAALPESPTVCGVEIAGPGFINFRVTDAWLHDTLREIAAKGAAYGHMPRNGQRVQVEFVSANPTGPLTIGHARNAAIGDALARVLDAAGWDVEREYYFNDAGGQMDRFGASVEARYLELCGREAWVPEDGYQGDYVTDIARDIRDAYGDSLADLPDRERFERLRAEGASHAMESIRSTLSRFGVTFDVFFSEAELERKGEIEQAVERLRDAGYAYEADGAVWFRSTDLGDDKDRVVVRSNGAHTYFGADCAYLIDKFSRGFDHVIYVWGADHHGDVARVKGAARALGLDPDRVETLIYQFVSFLRGGEPVKMSKRAGTFVSLDELIDEVGTDAARFHLLMFSNDHAMNFDIEEVKRQSMENPVYYVQYGHARIASILRKATAQRIGGAEIETTDLSVLATEPEIDLMKALSEVPAVLAAAAEFRAPHRLTHAAQDLAAKFHRFYTECRVVSDDAALTEARLSLCRATKQVLAELLGLLGVSAPESMERDNG
jgi:arginyl-tRNA synthetase